MASGAGLFGVFVLFSFLLFLPFCFLRLALKPKRLTKRAKKISARAGELRRQSGRYDGFYSPVAVRSVVDGAIRIGEKSKSSELC